MTITARYPGTCPTCHAPITPGQQIEWSKGAKPRHTTCGASRGPAAVIGSQRVLVADMPRRRRSGRGTWTGCACGSRTDTAGELIPSPRNCRQCEFDA